MYIIGIAGGTGSGKTTVVKRIASVLPKHCATIIPLDSYYNDTTGMTDEERKAINFDHPDAFDWKLLTEHIKMLKNGQAVEQPTYSYIISNRLPETVDSDVRLIRNIRRDVVERGRTVDMVLDRYEKVLKPMHEQFIEPTKKFADLIIPWGGDNKTGIHILKTYIEGIVTNV